MVIGGVLTIIATRDGRKHANAFVLLPLVLFAGVFLLYEIFVWLFPI